MVNAVDTRLLIRFVFSLLCLVLVSGRMSHCFTPVSAPVNHFRIAALNEEAILVTAPASGFAEIVSARDRTNIFRAQRTIGYFSGQVRVAFVEPHTLCSFETNGIFGLNLNSWTSSLLYTNPEPIKYAGHLTNLLLVSSSTPSDFLALVSVDDAKTRWRLGEPPGKVLAYTTNYLFLNNSTEPFSYTTPLLYEIRCLDIQTGKLLWKRRVRSPYEFTLARVFADSDNVWISTDSGLHWLAAQDGRVIKVAPMSTCIFFRAPDSRVYILARKPWALNAFSEAYTVYEVQGHKATRLNFEITQAFYDPPNTPNRRAPDLGFNSLETPFGENSVIFSAKKTRCFRLTDGSLQWEKRGQYKAHFRSIVYTAEEVSRFPKPSEYVIWQHDLERGTEVEFARYTRGELFGP